MIKSSNYITEIIVTIAIILVILLIIYLSGGEVMENPL